jgi:hypothetical protein
MTQIRSVAALGLALAACSSDTSLPVEPACNPLGAGHCMTPWPSSVFEVDDPGSATGRRLAIPEATLPANADAAGTGTAATDPAGWNIADGFSPTAPMVMAWKGGVSSDGLVPAGHAERSLAADSATVIFDMTTGARVAHVAALDPAAIDQPDSQALILQPSARLVSGHRYAVGITNRVHARDGGELAVPPGFAALRDHKNTDHELLEAMRPRFADVLAALDTAGVPAADLVVAWDFTVASDELLRRDLTWARDRALAALAAEPSELAITSDAPIDDGKRIRRRITGTLAAPLFLTQRGAATLGTTIGRDGAGLPALQGSYPIPFTAIVPACAYSAADPVAIVIHGHALFGRAEEAASAAQQTAAVERCAVVVGTELRGLSESDLPAVVRMLDDITTADDAMDVLEQGLVNHVALVRALRSGLADQVFIDPARPGRSLVDPAKLVYDGGSQPGRLSAIVAAYEPSVPRAAADPLASAPNPGSDATGDTASDPGLGLATSYAALLDRSADGPQFRKILAAAYPDPLDAVLALGLLQMRWDRIDATGP